MKLGQKKNKFKSLWLTPKFINRQNFRLRNCNKEKSI